MRPLLDSEYIFGIHEPGGEQHMLLAGKPGWIVFSEAIGQNPNDFSGVDFRPYSSQALGVICRLNHGYEPHGTIPHSSQYEAFARRVANFVHTSLGCKIWIIGNEMNHAVERPGIQIDWSRHPGIFSDRPEEADPLRHGLSVRFNALPDPSHEIRTTRAAIVSQGELITPDLYAQCYRLCADAIHRLPGHENDLVLVGAVCPWNTQTIYPGNPNGDWIQYFREILEHLGTRHCDGFALHAYTHGSDPALIQSDAVLEPPFQHAHLHFRTYIDFMQAVPQNMRHLPAFITETDQSQPWLDQNTGWVQAAFGEINQWNQQPNHQQIRALCLYHWPRFDRFYIEGKLGVAEDFVQALQQNYRWHDPDVEFVAGRAPATEQQTVPSQAAARQVGSLVGQVQVPQEEQPTEDLARDTAGTPDLQPYQIEWLENRFPETMLAGQTIEASFTLKNAGSLTWTWGGSHPFRLGYNYYRNRRHLPQRRERDLRTDVPHDVPPGTTVTIQARIVLPDQPGNYTLELDLIHEGVTWFKEQNSSPLTRWLTVEAQELKLTSTGDSLDNVGLPVPLFMDVSTLLPRAGTYGHRSPNQISHMVISHTAADASLGLEVIAETHIQSGYPGIAYNFVVDASGQIFKVTGLEEIAQPGQEWSAQGVNVCLAGDFSLEAPSLLQLDAASRLCAWLCENLTMSPDSVLGLGELTESDSPGQTFYNGANWKALLQRQVRLNLAMLSGGSDNELLRELEQVSDTLKKKNDALQKELRESQQERERMRLVIERLQSELLDLRHELETQTEIPATGLRIQNIVDQLPRDPGRYIERPASSVKYIVVNQTGAPPETDLKTVAESHRVEWPGLLYDFVIASNGVLRQAQPLDKVVDTGQPYLVHAVNVAFAGIFDTTVPTDEQLYAGGQLISWLLARFPNVELDNVCGLSELADSTSPGRQWLEGRRWKEMLLASVRRASGIDKVSEEETKLREQIDELERQMRALNRDSQRVHDINLRLETENAQLQAKLSEREQETVTQLIVPEPPIRNVVEQLPRHPSLRYQNRSIDQITHLAIHHTATPLSASSQRIAELHVNADSARGKDAWPGIGYHYFIQADGTIEQTNPLTTVSYHVYRHNEYTVGIGFVGSFMNGSIPTSAQIRSGAHLVAWLLQQLNIPLARVWGHREFPDNTTVCPGMEWTQGNRWRDILFRQIEAVQNGIGIKHSRHYMLFWQRAYPGPVARQDFVNAISYIARFRPTVGFSIDEARNAEYVTIVGTESGIGKEDEETLRAAGCHVERIVGLNEEDTGRILAELARLGRRFRDFNVDF